MSIFSGRDKDYRFYGKGLYSQAYQLFSGEINLDYYYAIIQNFYIKP